MMVAQQIPAAEFEKLRKFIYARTGIHLGDEKVSLLSNRLRKRVKALGLDSYEAYYKLLVAGDEEEMSHFLSAVTTNETYFFRNEKLWVYIADELIPGLVKDGRGRGAPLTFWSAACSTGAEAYTLAIVLREKSAILAGRDVQIVGSDISENVLNQARAAQYDDYALSKMTPGRRKVHFRANKETKLFELRDETKKMVRFEPHNLRDKYTRMSFDVVFVRNVMMYFDLPMKRLVLANVTHALKPGGYLIIGDVDPIRDGSGLRDDCTLEHVRPSLYRKPA